MKLANWLAMAALALAVLGILLFVEVIRPFHDLSIDGPLALLSWGSGAGLALVTLWLRGRSVILSAVSLSLNLVLLVAALVICGWSAIAILPGIDGSENSESGSNW